jgi:trimeric autotransporter adhesin
MNRQFISLVVFVLVVCNAAFAQVGIGTTTPDASAVLDVKSTTKGMLIPRMTTAQRTTITTPATGLQVFDTDTKSFWFYNGIAWSQLSIGSNGWNLTGNAVTNPSTNFIGTTDAQPLRFRVNNLWAGEIHPANGNIFLGVGTGESNTVGLDNTAIGYQSLFTNIDGSRNTAYGNHTLYSNKSGSSNTAHGALALFSNSSGGENSATGYAALYSNTIGLTNTANGALALFSNISGNNNTAIGNYALYANTTGNDNTATGYATLSNNTGSNNTATGKAALSFNTTGSFNSATGYQAAYTNESGSFNTINGAAAFYANTAGSFNTASGYQALNHNTTGLYNTASGIEALFFNKDGLYNTGNGSSALRSNTNGSYNTAIGNNAIYNNATGSNNTGVGNNALSQNFAGNYNTAIGTSALITNQNGSNNTAIGYLALATNSNGSNNTALGYAADVSTVVINATAIGSGAIVNASNKVRIGSSSVSVIEGQVAYSFPSDARFKYNIKGNVPGLEFIKKLSPVTYYFDEKKLDAYSKTGIINKSIPIPVSADKKQLHTGFLAQEVEKIAAELGYEFDGVHAPANDKDHYSLAYSQFIMPLVKAMQEQQAIITNQQKQIDILEKRLAILEAKK